MKILESTAKFEAWLRRQTRIVQKDLDAKHEAMDESPFVFLRATFYRWAQVWPDVCKKAASAPAIVAIGDLHVENFGTWRDAEGRLVWGVNDFDEAYPLPYTNDLVRLATSAFLASRKQKLAISPRVACDAILDGYESALDKGGRPVVLAERNGWLGAVAIEQLRDPRKFWNDLREGNQPARPPVPIAALRQFLPKGDGPPTILDRQAGAGSLGRKRCVAILDTAGGRIAREAKAVVPSAVAWLRGDTSNRIYGPDTIRHARRSHDPFLHFFTGSTGPGLSPDGWVVRRLAPDCIKIDMKDLPTSRDEPKLLRAMGWETANVHFGAKKQAILRDLRARRRRWLERAAGDMADVVIEDWRAWRRR